MEKRDFLKLLAGIALTPSVVLAKKTSVADEWTKEIAFEYTPIIKYKIGKNSHYSTTAYGRSKYNAFIKAILQQIANGLDVPYKKLTKDIDEGQWKPST